MTDIAEMQANVAQVAAVLDRSVTDSEFRRQLLTAPAATLQSAGVSIPREMEIQAVENTSSVVNLVIPAGVRKTPDVGEGDDAPSADDPIAGQFAALGALFSDASADSALEARLMEDPAAVLTERGIQVPPRIQLRAWKATDRVSYLTVPLDISNLIEYLDTLDLTNLQLLVTAGSYIAGFLFSLGFIQKIKYHFHPPPAPASSDTAATLAFTAAALFFLPAIAASRPGAGS